MNSHVEDDVVEDDVVEDEVVEDEVVEHEVVEFGLEDESTGQKFSKHELIRH